MATITMEIMKQTWPSRKGSVTSDDDATQHRTTYNHRIISGVDDEYSDSPTHERLAGDTPGDNDTTEDTQLLGNKHDLVATDDRFGVEEAEKRPSSGSDYEKLVLNGFTNNNNDDDDDNRPRMERTNNINNNNNNNNNGDGDGDDDDTKNNETVSDASKHKSSTRTVSWECVNGSKETQHGSSEEEDEKDGDYEECYQRYVNLDGNVGQSGNRYYVNIPRDSIGEETCSDCPPEASEAEKDDKFLLFENEGFDEKGNNKVAEWNKEEGHAHYDKEHDYALPSEPFEDVASGNDDVIFRKINEDISDQEHVDENEIIRKSDDGDEEEEDEDEDGDGGGGGGDDGDGVDDDAKNDYYTTEGNDNDDGKMDQLTIEITPSSPSPPSSSPAAGHNGSICTQLDDNHSPHHYICGDVFDDDHDGDNKEELDEYQEDNKELNCVVDDYYDMKDDDGSRKRPDSCLPTNSEKRLANDPQVLGSNSVYYCKNRTAFTRGICCTEPLQALEILRTSYKLTDVTRRSTKSIWTSVERHRRETVCVDEHASHSDANTKIVTDRIYSGTHRLTEMRKKIEAREYKLNDLTKRIIEGRGRTGIDKVKRRGLGPSNEGDATPSKSSNFNVGEEARTLGQKLMSRCDLGRADEITVVKEEVVLEPAPKKWKRKKKSNIFIKTFRSIKKKLYN